MEAIGLEVANCLVHAQTVTQAEVRSFDGHKWVIVLRGASDFILRSDRQSPRRFATLETAVAEVRNLGFQHCDLNMERWDGKVTRRTGSVCTSTAMTV